MNMTTAGIGAFAAMGAIAGTTLSNQFGNGFSVSLMSGLTGAVYGTRLGQRFISLEQADAKSVEIAKWIGYCAISGIEFLSNVTSELPTRCFIDPESLSCTAQASLQTVLSVASGVFCLYAGFKAWKTHYNKERILKSWIIEENEFQAIKRGPRLLYKIIDIPSKKVIKKGGIASNWLWLPGITNQIMSSQIILRNQQDWEFSKPIYVWEHPYEEQEISLLKSKKGLILNLYDKDTGQNLQTEFDAAEALFKHHFCEKTRSLLKEFAKNPIPGLCKKVRVAEVKMSGYKGVRIPDLGFYVGSSWPFHVTFTAATARSVFDYTMQLSHEYWGVTLIRYNGKFRNHAVIVIEGMRDGKYFMEATDLTGPSGVDYELVTLNKPAGRRFRFNPENLKWDGRTITFKRKRYIVEKMIKKTRLEASGAKKIQYHEYGCESVFGNGGDNCLTWAKKTLTLAEIFLEDLVEDKFVALTWNYTFYPDDFRNASSFDFHERLV